MKLPREVTAAPAFRELATGVSFLVREDSRRFRLVGTGRVQCLQGLVSCDVVNTGGRRHVFGALLSAKGMIVAPLWITLRETEIVLETPGAAAGQLLETLSKALPPRLCRVEQITDTTTGIGVYGPGAAAAVEGEELAVPAVARGAQGFDLVVPAAESGAILDRLRSRGAVPADELVMAACRILAGIPALGEEIDDRTLPQEVRYEELGAISYTKGCYLGQETVARLHFRGHTNRRLVLLVLDREPAAPPLEVIHEGKLVGRATSACWSDELDTWVAQALLRREVEDGAEVRAGAATAVVRVDRWLRDP